MGSLNVCIFLRAFYSVLLCVDSINVYFGNLVLLILFSIAC